MVICQVVAGKAVLEVWNTPGGRSGQVNIGVPDVDGKVGLRLPSRLAQGRMISSPGF